MWGSGDPNKERRNDSRTDHDSSPLGLVGFEGLGLAA